MCVASSDSKDFPGHGTNVSLVWLLRQNFLAKATNNTYRLFHRSLEGSCPGSNKSIFRHAQLTTLQPKVNKMMDPLIV